MPYFSCLFYVQYPHTHLLCHFIPYDYVYAHVSHLMKRTLHSLSRHRLVNFDHISVGHGLVWVNPMDKVQTALFYRNLPMLQIHNRLLWALCLLVVPSCYVMLSCSLFIHVQWLNFENIAYVDMPICLIHYVIHVIHDSYQSCLLMHLLFLVYILQPLMISSSIILLFYMLCFYICLSCFTLCLMMLHLAL